MKTSRKRTTKPDRWIISLCPTVEALIAVPKVNDPRYRAFVAHCQFTLAENLYNATNDPAIGIRSWQDFCDWWDNSDFEIRRTLVQTWARGFRKYQQTTRRKMKSGQQPTLSTAEEVI